MSLKLENAKNLYLRGIRDGEIKEVHENYMGETYTQHSTGVPDGKEGFKKFFEDFFVRNPKRDIKIVRAIEDGEYVFLHVHQYLNDGEYQWVTADIFRSDKNERIVEHWDVIDYYCENEKNKNLDPIFGEFEIRDIEKSEENKKIIRKFLVEIMQNQEYNLIEKYVSKDVIQHNIEIDQGIEEYKNYITNNNISYDFVFKVLAQGNYVVSYSKMLKNAEEYAHFDIFRIENQKIEEIWNVTEIMPKKEKLTNLGKF